MFANLVSEDCFNITLFRWIFKLLPCTIAATAASKTGVVSLDSQARNCSSKVTSRPPCKQHQLIEIPKPTFIAARAALARGRSFMKLLLIRHGETEHNVAGLLAGVTDSFLTNHGVLQTQRLGKHLVDRFRFSHIYASDLQRAYVTAGAIQEAQVKQRANDLLSVIRLDILREQDFGSLECTPWASKRESGLCDLKTPVLERPSFVPKETNEAMVKRADMFLDDHITPLLATEVEEENCIAVVSHGLFLAILWRTLLARFGTQSVTLGPEVGRNAVGRPLQYLPSWTNTGYLELEIHPHDTARPSTNGVMMTQASCPEESPAIPGPLVDWRLVIKAINSRDHLSSLKRTRGGLGSATFDVKQKNLDGFFKKPRVSGSGVP